MYRKYILCLKFSSDKFFVKLLDTFQCHVELHKLVRLIPSCAEQYIHSKSC